MAHRLSPQRRGERFLKPEEKDRYTTDKIVNAAAHYGERRLFTCRDTRLGNISSKALKFDETIAEVHEVDFITDVIPRIIDQVRQTDPKRKVRILDLGSGLGLFADQIRHEFGDNVAVFGTSLEKKHSAKAKTELLQHIRKNTLIGLHPDQREKILQFAKEAIHPNDAKWRGLQELHNYEEFDLMIDTYGELYYAYNAKEFAELLFIALLKLRPEGQLYIGKLPTSLREMLESQREKIRQVYSAEFTLTLGGAVFTKLKAKNGETVHGEKASSSSHEVT